MNNFKTVMVKGVACIDGADAPVCMVMNVPPRMSDADIYEYAVNANHDEWRTIDAEAEIQSVWVDEDIHTYETPNPHVSVPLPFERECSAPSTDALVKRIENWLAPYGFVNLTSSDDEFPSLSYLGDGEEFFEIRVQIGTLDGGAEDIFVHTNFEECGAVYGYSRYFETIIYHGDDINSAVGSCVGIHNAFVLYSELVSDRWKVTSTGGGCTAWEKFFDNGYAHISNDSSAILIDEVARLYQTCDYINIGLFDNDHQHIQDITVPMSDTLGVIRALGNIEVRLTLGDDE